MKKLSVETEKMYDLNDVQMDQVVGGKKDKKPEEKEPDTKLPESYSDFTDCHTTGDNHTCYSCMTC